MAKDLQKYEAGDDAGEPRGESRGDWRDHDREPNVDEDPVESEGDDGVHGPSDADLDDPIETVIYCPNCRSEVYIEAEQCGVCGHYLTLEENGELRWEPTTPMWARIISGFFLLVALLCVAGLVLMLFSGF